MDSTRTKRPPWEVGSSDADFPSISSGQQSERDMIRLQMLADELDDAQNVGDEANIARLNREIAFTQRQMGGAPSAPVRPTMGNRPPWETAEPAPSGRKYKLAGAPAPTEEPSPGFFRRGADIAVAGLSGIPKAISSGIGAISAVAPFARGATDPLAEVFAESGQAIDKSLLSAYQQSKQRELSRRLAATPGFFESAGEAASFLGENPLYALPMIAESGAMMVGGGLIGQGVRRGAGAVGLRAPSPMTSAAIGEGSLIAGGVSTDIARQDPNASRIPAIVAGAGGAAVSRFAGRLMGASDIDTAIASRMARGELTDVLTPAGTASGRFTRGVIGEGLLEEAPQSALERMALNYSGGRPLMEGVGGEMVLGAASGGVMGGGFGLRRPGGTYTPQELSAAQEVLTNPESDPLNKIGAADFIRRVETGTLGEEEANRRFNDTLSSIFTSADLAANKTVDILNPQQPTIGGMRGAFAAGPQGMMPEGITSTAPVTDETIQQWRARVGYGPNVWRGVQTPGQEWRESVQEGPNVWRYPVARGLAGTQRGLFAGGPEAMGQPRPVMGGISDTGGRAAALAGPTGLPTESTPASEQAPLGGPPAVSPAASAAGGLLQQAASQWDRQNRTGRSEEWMVGAAESNPAFESVAQEGSSIPAHGMAKERTLGGAVENLLNLLNGGIDPNRTLYYDSLTNPRPEALSGATGTAGGYAYRDGPFIITFREGLTGQPTSADITGVLVNPAHAEIAPLLQKMFPNLTVRTYDKVADVVAASKGAATKTTKTTKTATTTKGAKKAPLTLTEQLDEELELADAELDEARTKQIVAEVGKEKLGAEVQGAKQIKTPPGMPTLGTSRLVAIRNALLSKTGRMPKGSPAKDKKAVDALRAFAEAYNAYQNATTSAIRDAKYGQQQLSEEKLANLQKLANDTRNALFAVGQALDNNAKNVEAVVRVVKDAVQRKLAKPGKTSRETLEALQSMDTMLSSAWTAAKRETFMGETADMADVSGQLIRPSQEKQEKGETKSSLEKAADGYSRPPIKGKVSPTWKTYYGLAGVLQYLSFNTTPMGKVLAAALRDAVFESENPAKIVFTDKGGSRYDPKTNTVYINRNEQSSEVVLHEAFHAALQWYVYQNPDAPAVKSLQKSLEKALAAQGLEGKALEVQQILQKLVNDKRGLDAVLEMVSYTATLNDFRKAMQQLKGGDAPASFWSAVRKVWGDFKALVRTFLGVNDSVASDVLAASMELLEKSTDRKNKMPEKLTGKVLDIATTAFKRWFGDSKIVNKDGTPKVMYHGTARDIYEFRAKQAGAIFLTDDPRFAEGFTSSSEEYMVREVKEALGASEYAALEKKAKNIANKEGTSVEDELNALIKESLPSRANIIPVYVSAQNPFDFQKRSHLDKLFELIDDEDLMNEIMYGEWEAIESSAVQEAIKFAGFDGFYVMEGGRKNLAVYQSNQIKSVFNQTPTEAPGILEASVQSGKATQTAAGVTGLDMRTFSQRVAPEALSTRFLFDALGWETRVAKPVQEGMTKLAALIRKEFPAAERFLILMNSTFSAGQYATQGIKDFKFDKNVGYQQMERLSRFVENRPADQVRALFDYMDGNKKALDGLQDKEVLVRTADNVMQWFKAYISELPESERRFFANRKFSESLLYATRSEQIARSTVGAQKLSSVMALKHRTETTLEGFKDWMAKDENGDIDLDSRFYQVFKTEGLKPGEGPEPAGFMSISEFEKMGRKSPLGFQVDATRDWWISQYTQGEKYKFSSSMTAKQALDEGKADQLANAMRNTFSALAVNYASKRFFQNLSTAGYEDGKPTALSVAFDDLDSINKLMKEIGGRVVREDQVLQVSERMARSPEIISMYRRTGTWVQLPESETYGALAGKIVPGPVWSALLDASDKQPLVQSRTFNGIMRWFKKSKTVYNPGTHVTNIASNFTLAMMHDIPVATIAKAAKMFALYEVSPNKLTKQELDLVAAFTNSGAMLGDYSSAEVKQALYDAWGQNLSDGDNSTILKRLTAFANYEKSKTKAFVDAANKLGKKVDDIVVETYTAEDNVFRLAAFLTKVGDLQNLDGNKEATPEQIRAGGDFAREAFLDYDIDSKAVRVLRQSFLPFVSWTYAIMPVLGRMALHQPWKFANTITALYVMEAALAAMAGGGDDDEETRKMGPEYMRERMLFGMGPHMFFRMPGGDAENPVYYKFGDYVPFVSLTKGLPNGAFGQSWIPGAITPGGPFLTAAAGIIAGVDPYTGKSIHQPTDSEWDKFWNAAKFGYDVVTPPAISSRNLGKAKDIIDEKTGITGVEPSSLVFARMMGLKMYDYNVPESLAIQDKRVKGIERDFKAAMKKAKEEEYRKGYPDYEALDKELDTLRNRMEERIANVRGEEFEGEE